MRGRKYFIGMKTFDYMKFYSNRKYYADEIYDYEECIVNGKDIIIVYVKIDSQYASEEKFEFWIDKNAYDIVKINIFSKTSDTVRLDNREYFNYDNAKDFDITIS